VIISVVIGPNPTHSVQHRREAGLAKAKPPHEAVVEPAELKMLHLLKEQNGEPAMIWELINKTVNHDRPKSKVERDRLRLWAWSRIKRLLHLGALERVRRRWIRLPTVGVEAQSRAWSTRLRRVGRRASHLRKRTTANGLTAQTALAAQTENQKRSIAPSTGTVHMVSEVEAKVSAQVSAERISDAARLLRLTPPQRRFRYTGRIGTKRVRVCRRVELRGGMFGFVLRAFRGRVLVGLDEEPADGSSSFLLLPEREVCLHKNAGAVLLGQMKLGTAERPSLRKARSSRRNGHCPVRPGSRPRGRPRVTLVRADSQRAANPR
jgi:hypothetical protein